MRKDGIQTRKRKPKKSGSGDLSSGASSVGKKDDSNGEILLNKIIYKLSITNIYLSFFRH